MCNNEFGRFQVVICINQLRLHDATIQRTYVGSPQTRTFADTRNILVVFSECDRTPDRGPDFCFFTLTCFFLLYLFFYFFMSFGLLWLPCYRYFTASKATLSGNLCPERAWREIRMPTNARLHQSFTMIALSRLFFSLFRNLPWNSELIRPELIVFQKAFSLVDS